MTFVLTPVFTDTFHRANENPLNAANYAPAPGDTFSLQVVGNVCEGNALAQFNSQNYIGSVIGNDQYVTITVGAFATGFSSEFDILIRSDSEQLSSYDLSVVDNDDGTAAIALASYINGGPGPILYSDGGAALPTPGETFTVGMVGSKIFFERNGVLLFQGTDTTYASGFTAFSVAPENDVSDVTITKFETGSVTISSGVDTTVEFQGLRFKAHNNGDGTYSISTHDISGGTGVADQTLEIQGFRLLAHDNGDGTFSFTTAASGGPNDVSIEREGLRFKITPTGGTAIVDGVSVPTYAIVVNEV
jgi:hypothetical protein